MAYEQKPESGSLFKNDRKTADNHPDYKGTALIAGVEYWVSAWIKVQPNGQKRFSMSYKVKEQQNAQPPQQADNANPDDLPF